MYCPTCKHKMRCKSLETNENTNLTRRIYVCRVCGGKVWSQEHITKFNVRESEREVSKRA